MTTRQVLDLAPLGFPEVPMLGRYDYAAAEKGLLPHAHPATLEICYLARGRQLYRVGDRDFVLSGGDVFVTFPDESHSTGETPEEKGTLYWLQLRLPGKNGRLLGYPPALSRSLVHRLRRLPRRHFAGDPRLSRLLDEVFTAATRPADALQRIRIQNRLADFLLTVIGCATRPPAAAVSGPIRHVLQHIESHLDQPLPLATLARQGDLSLPRFKARFKRETGIPPAEYVLRRRIDHAKTLLRQPGATVTAVAFQLGFSSSQYFATTFRRYTGQAPRTHLPR